MNDIPSPTITEKNIEATPFVELGLGDIIQLIAPTNSSINEQIYLIEFIDQFKIKLINVATLNKLTLTLKDSGGLSDESISSIYILNQPKEQGYARQNLLLPNTWVDIYFGGDLPVTITGQITDLENDTIEIKTYPEEQTIYLDFGYQGIPENLPIERINIRSPPSGILPIIQESITPKEFSESGEPPIPQVAITTEIALEKPVQAMEVRTILKEILLDADQIEFGDDLETLTTLVDVPEEQKRYSIEKQTNDLLNELLATIPSPDRTKAVLASIHKMIERFKQLRNEFSVFDSNGNANMPTIINEKFKPLMNTLTKLNQKLFWILPISQDKKKIYVTGEEIIDDTPDIKIIENNNNQIIQEYNSIFDSFKSGEDDYYNYINKLDKYLTPFTSPDMTDPSIYSHYINANLNAVIDNLGDFYSSVFEKDRIKRQKFVIQTYNLGFSKLEMKQVKIGTKTLVSANVTPLTKNDKIYITSFLTLPAPAMQFSRSILPSTNIMLKSNFNEVNVNYWQLLRKNTSVTRLDIGNLQNPSPIDLSKMVDEIQSFITDDTIDSESKYQKFLDTIIPETSFLFELMKGYIQGPITLPDILSYLEPFMIYSNNISDKTYKEMTTFMSEKINEYKKLYIDNSKEFAKFSKTKYIVEFTGISLFYNLLKGSKLIDINVLDSYGFLPNEYLTASRELNKLQIKSAIPQTRLSKIDEEDENIYLKNRSRFTETQKGGAPTSGSNFSSNTFLSTSEILWRMTLLDCTQLYMNAVAVVNSDLITYYFTDIIRQEKEKYDNKLEAGHRENNTCKNFVIAKKYLDEDDMKQDNGETEVYFDKTFDFTDYKFIEKYKKQQVEMSPDDFESFLVDQYMKKSKLPITNAQQEIDNILKGRREVKNGAYAVLEVENEDKVRYEYFIRKDNQWVKDDTIESSIKPWDNTYFCNVKPSCFAIEKQCLTNELAEESLHKSTIDQMMNEFDANFHDSRERILTKIQDKYNRDLQNIVKLNEIKEKSFMKYNDIQYLIGLGLEEKPMGVISPYARIFDLILGHGDYVTKQRNIVRFMQRFCREAFENTDESIYWYYCKETGAKLMPTFFVLIANTFLNQGDVDATIDSICKERGKKSEDGDSWVDEYSGYIIMRINLEIEEGYDAAGKKLQTRDVLEADLGDSLLQSQQVKKIMEFTNPDAQMVSKVVTILANFMGIDIESQRKFIVNNTIATLEANIKTEEAYKRGIEKMMQQAQRKEEQPKPYREYKLSNLILLTFCYYVTGIQIAIPSIKSKKTFPGCVRSFKGYPIDGDGDMSSIKYVCCIASQIKNKSIEPWNSIAKTNETKLMTAVKTLMDKYIVTNPIIEGKFQEKREYNLIETEEELPMEHDIKKWINFLPPLVPIKNKTPTPLGPNFNSDLKNELVKGLKDQYEKINVIKSKIIYYSLAIQSLIQNVISKEKLILTNNANEPFIENACCNTKDSLSTIQYFATLEPNIVQYNSEVTRLRNMLIDIHEISESAYLFDEKNTRIKYPELSNIFTEETIYLAFITYCKFNLQLPIPDNVTLLCQHKPELYDPYEDSLEKRIKQIKESGLNYTEESLVALMQIVAEQNIIKMNLNPTETSYIQRLRDILNTFQLRDKTEIPKELVEYLNAMLDTYDVLVSEDTEEMRKLNNYLGDTNIRLVNSIVSYIMEHISLNKKTKKKLEDLLTNIMESKEIGEDITMNNRDATTYRSMQFVQNVIENIVNVFPNMIINNAKTDEINIPLHWGLSKVHMNDIDKIVMQYYKVFKNFMNDKDKILEPILKSVPLNCKEFYLLSMNTPLFAEITNNKNRYYSIFNEKVIKLLYTFYFLNIIYKYIQISKDSSLMVKEEEVRREEMEEILSTLQAQDESNGVISEINIVTGESLEVGKKLAQLLMVYFETIENDKDTMNVDNKSVKEAITRLKDKEKDDIVNKFKGMSKNELIVENLQKNLRLGDWNKGLQKGLTTYVADTYEQERAILEKEMKMDEENARRENKVQKSLYAMGPRREIFMIDDEIEDNVQREVNKELDDVFRGQGDDDEVQEEDWDDGEEMRRDDYSGDFD